MRSVQIAWPESSGSGWSTGCSKSTDSSIYPKLQLLFRVAVWRMRGWTKFEGNSPTLADQPSPKPKGALSLLNPNIPFRFCFQEKSIACSRRKRGCPFTSVNRSASASLARSSAGTGGRRRWVGCSSGWVWVRRRSSPTSTITGGWCRETRRSLRTWPRRNEGVQWYQLPSLLWLPIPILSLSITRVIY